MGLKNNRSPQSFFYPILMTGINAIESQAHCSQNFSQLLTGYVGQISHAGITTFSGVTIFWYGMSPARISLNSSFFSKTEKDGAVIVESFTFHP